MKIYIETDSRLYTFDNCSQKEFDILCDQFENCDTISFRGLAIRGEHVNLIATSEAVEEIRKNPAPKNPINESEQPSDMSERISCMQEIIDNLKKFQGK